MENHSTDALLVRLDHTKERGKSIGGNLKLWVDVSLQEIL